MDCSAETYMDCPRTNSYPISVIALSLSSNTERAVNNVPIVNRVLIMVHRCFEAVIKRRIEMQITILHRGLFSSICNPLSYGDTVLGE